MTSKSTFLKYMFGAIFYICTCVLCLSIRQNYLTISHLRLKNGTLVVKCKPFHKVISQLVQQNTVPSDANIQELDYHYPRGRIIDSEKVLHLQSISEACTHYNISSVLVKRHYLYSPKNTTLYCWTRKAASTSFVKLISDMWDRRVTKDYDKEIDILSPKTMEELKNLISNDGVFKFMVVRHPFERIVSSYRDRLEDNTKYTDQGWIYAPKIFHLTRPHLFHTNATTGSSLSQIFQTNKKLKLVPTFKEFIVWLLRQPTAKDDVHWESYYSHCSVCDINYNFILKLENYTFREIDFLFSKIGLAENEVYLPRLEETRNGFTDYDRTCSYFNALNQDMIYNLYKRYQIDFEMFDYTYENYMDCANNSKVNSKINVP